MPCSAKHQQQDGSCGFDSLEARLAATRAKIEDLRGVFDSKDCGKSETRVEGRRNEDVEDSGSNEDFSFVLG